MYNNDYWEEWSYHIWIIVETCKDKWISRPRVKPLDWPDININFPRELREKYPIWTRFEVDVKVCKKPNQSLYLYSYRETIKVVEWYKPRKRIFAEKQNTISDRVYRYIEI